MTLWPLTTLVLQHLLIADRMRSSPSALFEPPVGLDADGLQATVPSLPLPPSLSLPPTRRLLLALFSTGCFTLQISPSITL